MIHTKITATEQADRLAISELVDAYAHCADRRDAEGQKALFTEVSTWTGRALSPRRYSMAPRR